MEGDENVSEEEIVVTAKQPCEVCGHAVFEEGETICVKCRRQVILLKIAFLQALKEWGGRA